MNDDIDFVLCDFWNDKAMTTTGERDLNELPNILSSKVDCRLVSGWDGVKGHPIKFCIAISPASPRGFMVSIKYMNKFGSTEVWADFRQEKDQLFLESVADYLYPNQTKYQLLSQSKVVTSTYYEPDGRCTVDINDEITPEHMITRYTDVDVSKHWAPIPQTLEDFWNLAHMEILYKEN